VRYKIASDNRSKLLKKKVIVAEVEVDSFDGSWPLPYDEKQPVRQILTIERLSFLQTGVGVGGFATSLGTCAYGPTITDPQILIMRIAYLDCFSGISGDMFLGALVDAGVPRELLTETVAALNLGARVEISRVSRGGLMATKVDVYGKGERDRPRDRSWEKLANDQHSHGHQHSGHSGEPVPDPGPKPVQLAEHNYGLAAKTSEHRGGRRQSRVGSSAFPEDDPHSRAHGHPPEPTRGLMEIRQMISSTAISETAKKTAIMIFDALGSSEPRFTMSPWRKFIFTKWGQSMP